jgi:hypothetical protein
MIRTRRIGGLVAAAVLLALAACAAVLAADVRSWQRTMRSEDALLVVSPREPAWLTPARFPFGLAGRALGVRGDVALRRSLALYLETVDLHARLDNATDVAGARVRAEQALAAVARRGGAQGSQAGTLLGILAFGDLGRGGFANGSQANTSLSDFADAVRADPSNEEAKYDLELLLRLLEAHGTRVGNASSTGVGSTGRRGAGGGVPGSGY